MAAKHNTKNERIKHAYMAYLRDADGHSPSSIHAAAAAVAHFEETTKHKDFAQFHIEQAKRFKRVLAETRNINGRPLAKSTISARLRHLRNFFKWLAERPGYKSRISHPDCDYFNPPTNDERIASARRERPVPEIGQVLQVLRSMPFATPIERRDRALVAFTLLSGARDDAIASLNIGHVDLERRTVFQDARNVRTKNRKTFTSAFFPVGNEVEAIVVDWVAYMREVEHYGADDPLFPATLIGLDSDGQFAVVGLKREHWRDAGRIRAVFKRAFRAAGLPYSNPHLIRKTLERMIQKSRPTPEEEKAWSQNLGHEHLRTTINSYGTVPEHRQIEVMDGLRAKLAKSSAGDDGDPDPETVAKVLAYIDKIRRPS